MNMLQGEPSVHRSSRLMKRVDYSGMNDSNKEKKSEKIRRLNSTAYSQSIEFLQLYSEDISVICAFNKSVTELILEISSELTNKLSFIESHAHSARITKSETNSEIVKVDSIVTRYYDRLSIWHIEVASGLCNMIDIHTLDNTIKTLRMDKNKSFCIQIIDNHSNTFNMLPDGRFISSELNIATVLFSFHSQNQFKAIFRMMTIFHNEITKQEELIGEIDRVVLRSKGITV
ncbi:5793_t:CDS:2 [Funneliformis mosseae]|uniref:5793_t:CDS:1 n=1 Tax=Funneliformis mosseae TaxID=27381 RepID=A0A9N9GTV3_FUNMO|nr:5793_t:CDS:2 [Funneliformis mosseae]